MMTTESKKYRKGESKSKVTKSVRFSSGRWQVNVQRAVPRTVVPDWYVARFFFMRILALKEGSSVCIWAARSTTLYCAPQDCANLYNNFSQPQKRKIVLSTGSMYYSRLLRLCRWLSYITYPDGFVTASLNSVSSFAGNGAQLLPNFVILILCTNQYDQGGAFQCQGS